MSNTQSKTTVLVITIGFIVLYLVYDQTWMILTSLLVGSLGAFSEWMAEKIHWLWFKLAYILSLFIPKILLAFIFFIFLVPVAIIYRAFSNDPLQLKKPLNSTFRDVPLTDVKKSLTRIW